MTTKREILFVDDEEPIRNAVSQTFDLADMPVRCISGAREALRLISRDFDGIVITDVRMPNLDGQEFLSEILKIDFELPVILVTGHGDVKMAVEAMGAGAYDFIEKPFASDHLVQVAKRALEKRAMTLENRELRSAVTKRDKLETMITGRTKAIVDVRTKVRTVAATDADVLVTGDTGTGKEVVARAIHALSDRADRPFVAITCGALPGDMIESELFGHEAGAFAGALRPRYGKFEHARRGTIYLDEIETMPLELQLRLLRVVQEGTITRLGSNDPIELNVRFIASTKVDLEEEVSAGRFREDLYYILNVVRLDVPSLADRREDIPRLFTQLANEAARRYRRDFVDIPQSLLAEITQADWPGNVRQLRNAADRFVMGLDDYEDPAPNATGTLSERVAAYEKQVIIAELSSRGGSLKDTYEALRISRKSLYEKMQRYGLKREDYKD